MAKSGPSPTIRKFHSSKRGFVFNSAPYFDCPRYAFLDFHHPAYEKNGLLFRLQIFGPYFVRENQRIGDGTQLAICIFYSWQIARTDVERLETGKYIYPYAVGILSPACNYVSFSRIYTAKCIFFQKSVYSRSLDHWGIKCLMETCDDLVLYRPLIPRIYSTGHH